MAGRWPSNSTAEGAAVAALDLKPDGLASLAAELGEPRLATAVGDVTNRDSLYPAVRELERRLGPTDVLIANAGIGSATAADPYDADGIEAMIRVNLIGVSNSIGAVLPGMIERRRGQVVGIASLASYRGLPKMAGYCASKAGVCALLEALRVEVQPLGIGGDDHLSRLDSHAVDREHRRAAHLPDGAGRGRPADPRRGTAAAGVLRLPGPDGPAVPGCCAGCRRAPSDWLVRRMMAAFAKKEGTPEEPGPR